MADRQQLPPQIKRIELSTKVRGRPSIRYQLTVDVGIDPTTGKRKQLRKRYRTEAEAREALDGIRGDVNKGIYVHPTTLTVRQACDDWLLSRHKLKPTTKRSCYDDSLKPVRSELGDLPVQKLTRRHLDELVEQLRAGSLLRSNGRPRKPWSPRSCNLMLGIVGQVLDQVIEEGHLSRNVARQVDRVAGKPEKFDTFTEDQVETVLTAVAGDRNRHAWHMALSGMRRGELCGQRWTDVDLKAKTIRIGATRVSAAGAAIDQDDAKSETSGRVLPIPDGLLAELKVAKTRQARERLAMGHSYADRGYVVCNEVGEPYHPDTLTKMWTKSIADLDVPRVRLHDARHTCGTLLHLQGVPIAVISAWLGHADNAFTMRTYVHSQPDALMAAAQTLGSVVTTRDKNGSR